jgi:hypothetical protein
VKRMRPTAPLIPRSRSFARRTATGPIPLCIWHSGPCLRRSRRPRPSGSRTPASVARSASASASIAWASSWRAPLLRTAVSGSSASSGRRSGITAAT